MVTASRTGSWRLGRIRVLAILVVAAVGLVGCTGGGDSAAVNGSMSVSPQPALLDQPVKISVRGLPAGARTTVTAKATDAGGKTWSASAQFEATSAGVVSLDQPSLDGSYSGVNPMGLFQFMTPPSDSKETGFLGPASGYDVILQATIGDRVAATTTAHRQSPSAVGVVEKKLRPAADGIYGNLYLPKNTSAKRPAVLAFGGSNGGLERTFDASLLAAHGYPSLALAYFKVPGLPRSLVEIPLEYFAKSLAVLREQPGVDPDHVLVMGYSRGGEAALLLGAYFPKLVNGVIAGVPSSVVNPGFPDASRSAWTLRGRPLPAVSPSEFGQAAPADAPEAVIPVEKTRGPILLTCGGQDAVWPSCAYTDAITARLTAHQFAYPVTALRYPDAGHFAGNLTAYYSLTDAALTTFGGTLPGTQTALADGHTKLLALLASQ
jgi:pimeloyl-ACP methyl ester carboxylesterase